MDSRPAAIAALCVAGALAGCSSDSVPEPPDTPGPTPKGALAQSAFDGCGEFRRYHARALLNRALRAFENCWGCAPPPEGDVLISYTGTALSTMDGPEPAADAPDLVAIDGQTGRLYAVSRGELLSVAAVPAEAMEIRSRLAIDGLEALYLDSSSDRLVALGNRYDADFGDGYNGSTQLRFYDLTDPDHPELVDRYEVSGALLAARRVGQRLHVVTGAWAEFPRSLRDDKSFSQLRGDYLDAFIRRDEWRRRQLAGQIRVRIERAVEQAPLADLLPSWSQGISGDAAALECAQVLRPQVDVYPGFTVVSSIGFDGSGAAQVASVGSSSLYAGAEHAYLALSSSRWWWSTAQDQQTAVYRFRLEDAGPAQPAGYAVVDGFLSGGWDTDYAESEHDGYLRLITTERLRDEAWRRTSHLFVLGATDTEPFAAVGQLSDFAAQGFGVTRFFGALGIATGRAPSSGVPDPVLTFDLADAAAPAVAGTLPLNGKSNYLLGLGPDRLLAQTSITSYEGQVELQVFDVTDPVATQPVQNIVFGEPGQWAWGVTYYEPEALAMHGDLLVVPLQIGSPDASTAFGGFVAYHVTAGALVELGRTDHKEMDGGDGCIDHYNGGLAPCATFAPVHLNLPLAALRVDEPGGRTVLYTLSDAFLKADAVGDTLTPIHALPLAE